ncbi:unnamed protein product, partial [Onchocerca ochengi]|uniref:Uncharacterized protein n=1 Tax=Onchocerca ochengi TaxID=42157 RepID=A0A182EWX4_ONCOC
MIAGSDPSTALLEFSKSFKKIRRCNTDKIKIINREKFTGQRNIRNTTVHRYGKVRSTSLPDPDDLCAVVRDNNKRLQLRSIGKNSTMNEMNFRRKNQYERDRFSSLCVIISSSLSLIPNDNHYLANDYFGHNLRSNGPVDHRTIKSLRSTVMLVSKLNLPNAMRQIYR